MADKKWWRCELRSRDGDEILGYFITQAERADGVDSAAEVYYDLFTDCGCPAQCYHEEAPALEEVVACDDPTIPNDFSRTADLRSKLAHMDLENRSLVEENRKLREREEEPTEELSFESLARLLVAVVREAE